MGYMDIMDQTGHTRHIWDPDDDAEVEAAKVLYNTLTKKGYRAFHVKKDGEEGVRMDTFDPDAAKMILQPQLRGG
jgi:hypothetical protein